MKKAVLSTLLAPLFLLNPNSNSQTPKLELIAQETQQTQQTTQIQNPASDISSLTRHLKAKGFDIDSLISNPRFKIDDSIVIRFEKASENIAKNYEEYKKIHKYEYKKRRIPEFMKRNMPQLEAAEETYGVPKEIISAIFGIESNFGFADTLATEISQKSTGKFNPFNAYVSMHVRGIRPDLAIPQLIELLRFCRKNSINVFDLRSSYAGAISYAQFLPSSLNKWFIGNDLYSMDDNITSVANYLSHFRKIGGSLERAVYRYNPKGFYVRFVMDLAKEAEKTLAGSQ